MYIYTHNTIVYYIKLFSINSILYYAIPYYYIILYHIML